MKILYTLSEQQKPINGEYLLYRDFGDSDNYEPLIYTSGELVRTHALDFTDREIMEYRKSVKNPRESFLNGVTQTLKINVDQLNADLKKISQKYKDILVDCEKLKVSNSDLQDPVGLQNYDLEIRRCKQWQTRLINDFIKGNNDFF